MTASNLADSAARVEKHDVSTNPGADRIGPYVSRILLEHLAHDPESRHWSGEGTAAFVDISGFTKLSEALARKGRGANDATISGKSNGTLSGLFS